MFGFVGSVLTWFGLSSVARFAASKIVWTAIVTVVLLPGLWNLALRLIAVAGNWAIDQIGAITLPGVPASILVQWTDLLGWLGNVLRIPEIVSFVSALLVVKLTLRFIGSVTPLRVVR